MMGTNSQIYYDAVDDVMNDILDPEKDYIEIFLSAEDTEALPDNFQVLARNYLHRGLLREAAKSYSLSLEYDSNNYELVNFPLIYILHTDNNYNNQ